MHACHQGCIGGGLEGAEGVTPPNIFMLARKLVKSQPC